MTTIEQALTELRAGRVVVIPTDTVYGLAASLDRAEGIRALFEIKGRPPSKALPVLGSDSESLRAVARMDGRMELIATRFWPGPLTVVLPRAQGFDRDLGGANDGTVAVRVPASEMARRLLAASGPLAVTSANRSGFPPANSVDEARREFGDSVTAYLDDGPGAGSASTVVSLVGEPRVLREGAVTEAELEEVLGE